MRAVSDIVVMLIIVGAVIAASIFVSWILIDVLGVFKPTTTMTVIGGTGFVDPSDSNTVVGEALVSIVGPDRVEIVSIYVAYGGETYTATCMNCRTVINPNYPNSGNDVVSLRFYFTTTTTPQVGDKVEVVIAYRVRGELKYSGGTIVITK